MKTLIQVWTHHCYNMPQTETDNYWGLGDVLRGTIQMYMLSKKLGFKLYVDISLHPVSKFLLPTENPFADLIQENKDRIRMIPADEDLVSIINNLEDGSFFFTNAYCTEDFDDDCKNFMKQILTPIPSLEQSLKAAIPFDPYQIMHFRLGDEELVGGIENGVSENIRNLITSNKDGCDVLISDSFTLKSDPEVAKEVFVLKTVPQHLGKCADADSVKDTLVDFFLISRSKGIKTYSSYEWVSGFVFWAHKIYDIPLRRI